MSRNKSIQEYYDLCNCCLDNVEFVAFLIQMINLKPLAKVTKSLEDLKLTKYENDITLILDNLTITTIRDLQKIYKIKKEIIVDE